MEEEDVNVFEREPTYDLLCKCLLPDGSSEQLIIPPRKQKILNTVSRTESYLRERRIPELIRFLLTKIIAEGPEKPVHYLEQLLNDCMLFRAGHGAAPVLYENRHLEAVIKSFDPGQRGWLSSGQIKRLYMTLGLTPDDYIDDKVPTDVVLANVVSAQETELLSLLRAGFAIEDISEIQSSDSSGLQLQKDSLK